MKRAEDNWNQCCKGEVSRLVSTLRQTKHSQVARGRIIVGAASLVLLAGFILVRGGLDSVNANVQGITCREVHSYTDEFLAGELDETLTMRVEAHLEYCGSCVRHIDEARRAAEAVKTKSDELSVAAL